MSYIGQGLPADSFQGFTTDSFTGDGSATTFTLSKKPFDESALLVVINNVVQKPTTNFTVSGTTLTIVGTAVADGDVIYATHMGGALPIGEAASLTSNILTSQTDIGAAIADADLFLVDDGAGGTLRKVAASRIKTYAGGTDLDGAVTINDSSADVDFRVESNGNANMLVVDGGNDAVSIGAAYSENMPSHSTTGLQVQDAKVMFSQYSADTTAATLEFVKSRGTTAGGAAGTAINSGDIIASIVAYGDDSNSFEVAGKLQFMAGENWGDGDCAGQFELYLTPDGSTTTDLKLRMLNDGRMGVGVYPDASGDARGLPVSGRLHATEDTANMHTFYGTTTATSGIVYGCQIQHHGRDPDDNTSRFYGGGAAAGNRFLVFSDGDVVNHDNSYGSISDERIKSNIVDANSQWDDIKALKVRNYKKNDDITKYGDKAWVQLGVIAQELEASGMDKLVKNETKYESGDLEVVNGDKNVGDIKEYKSVKYSILYMKAIKALQEAITKIETLETKVKALEDA